MKKQSNLSRLLSYAGRYRNFTYASCILSAVSALIALVPFWYIWKIIKEVLEVSPNFSEAVNIVSSVFSFKKFKGTIDEYAKWVIAYTKDMRVPMMIYTAAANGVFAFLIAGALWFSVNGVTNEFLLNLIFYIIITPVISLTLTRIMFMSEDGMIVSDALSRVDGVLSAAFMPESEKKRISEGFLRYSF